MGVDRLFHLEQRLRDLGACKTPDEPYLVTRPSDDLTGVDASGLDLHFFPSLNSPYTAIIFDRTVTLAQMWHQFPPQTGIADDYARRCCHAVQG